MPPPSDELLDFIRQLLNKDETKRPSVATAMRCVRPVDLWFGLILPLPAFLKPSFNRGTPHEDTARCQGGPRVSWFQRVVDD